MVTSWIIARPWNVVWKSSLRVAFHATGRFSSRAASSATTSSA